MTQAGGPLRILHIEDNVADGEFVREIISTEWPGCEIRRVDSQQEFLEAFEPGRYDLILSDFTLPQFSGMTALALARARDSVTPFIFLSGTIGEDNAVQALHRGASDYIIKDRPSRLVPAIKRALELNAEQKMRQEAERRVREQAGLLDKARDAIVVVDDDSRITFWNKGAARIFGWSAAEATGLRGVELFGPEAVRLFGVSPKPGEEEWHGEVWLNDRRSGSHVLDARVTVIRDTGATESRLIIATDVTAQRSMEKQFLRAQRLESIGILAGGIAHDLNNVLAPILMAVDLLQMRTQDPEMIRLLGIMQTSAVHGAGLIRQVLAFARGAEGERGPMQLQQVIKEVSKLLRETLPRSIAIETDVAPELPAVSADGTQVTQVLMNLGVNARDAMPSGGRLVLRAQKVVVGPAAARAHPGASAGPHVLISVEDTGAGIGPEIIDRIFDPFFTTKVAGKGTGLGLSAVLGIMRNHGGFLDVKSDVGAGTIFSLYFPALTAPDTPRRSADHRPPDGRAETVLVIDDEESVRNVTESLLARRGYRVLLAEDGVAGLAMYAQYRHEIQVVLTDMMMPALPGSELIRELRTLNPDVRIVAMSGVLPTQSNPIIESATLTVVPKPMTGDDLIRALQRVLPGTG